MASASESPVLLLAEYKYAASYRLFPPITVFDLIVRKISSFQASPLTFRCCSVPASRVSVFQRGEATPTFERPSGGEEREGNDMTIKPAVGISDRNLVVKNRTVLTGVPDNVMATSASSSGAVEGIFLGAAFDGTSSCHLVPLGTLRDVSRFMACFRFKLWWMAQKMS